MGIRNLRATCPTCHGAIRTTPKGLGRLTWMASGPLVQTGTECPHCGTPLTGKVRGTTAVAAKPPAAFAAPTEVAPSEKGWWKDPTGRYDLRYFSGRFWTADVAITKTRQQLVDPQGAPATPR